METVKALEASQQDLGNAGIAGFYQRWVLITLIGTHFLVLVLFQSQSLALLFT